MGGARHNRAWRKRHIGACAKYNLVYVEERREVSGLKPWILQYRRRGDNFCTSPGHFKFVMCETVLGHASQLLERLGQRRSEVAGVWRKPQCCEREPNFSQAIQRHSPSSLVSYHLYDVVFSVQKRFKLLPSV